MNCATDDNALILFSFTHFLDFFKILVYKFVIFQETLHINCTQLTGQIACNFSVRHVLYKIVQINSIASCQYHNN